ncbi:MAG: sigma-70 family RNA polymerase sigma factor [Bacteroides sp.]|nr:sigma-70 family RNA polymerase sigma factor [Bacteroides sp.]MCM1422079.1 sigma-70 family RNA polymerase sigma factor [Bacteroides sp.]
MDIKDFEILIKRKRAGMLHQAQKLLCDEDEAEDAVQEASLRLWSIRSKICQYQSIDALITVIVRNICISVLRQRNIRMQEMFEGLEMVSSDTPHRKLEDKENGDWLDKKIEGLPASQMTILKMSQAEGMSNKEIAEVLGINEVSVRTALSKARHRLLEQLKNRR